MTDLQEYQGVRSFLVDGPADFEQNVPGHIDGKRCMLPRPRASVLLVVENIVAIDVTRESISRLMLALRSTALLCRSRDVRHQLVEGGRTWGSLLTGSAPKEFQAEDLQPMSKFVSQDSSSEQRFSEKIVRKDFCRVLQVFLPSSFGVDFAIRNTFFLIPSPKPSTPKTR